jgi:hypothetical protein
MKREHPGDISGNEGDVLVMLSLIFFRSQRLTSRICTTVGVDRLRLVQIVKRVESY